MKIAVYQGTAVRTEAAAAIATLQGVVPKAAAAGVRLVVLPELFLCGYGVGEGLCAAAETADGPASEAIAAIAARSGVAVLYGYPERVGDRIFNSAQLIDRAGRVAANYRKTHLYGDWERREFTPGEALVTAVVDDLKIGILICYDVEFPEAVRALALAGCDLVAVPTALVQPFAIVARILVPARAFENQVHVAYAGGGRGGVLRPVCRHRPGRTRTGASGRRDRITGCRYRPGSGSRIPSAEPLFIRSTPRPLHPTGVGSVTGDSAFQFAARM